MTKRCLDLVAVAFSIVACGQTAPPGAPGVPATAAPTPAVPGLVGIVPSAPAAGAPAVPQNPFAAIAQMAQGLQGAQAPNAGQIVNWRQLAEGLPAQVPGWNPEGELEGSTGAAMGFAVSEAKRRFVQGDRHLRFEVVDSSMNGIAAMGFNAARTVQVDSSTELQRPSDLQGNPGFVKYEFQSHEAEASFMISGRFIVTIHASGSPNADEILQLAAYVNLARLGQLATAAPVAPAPPHP
jgi:hypothetical protein